MDRLAKSNGSESVCREVPVRHRAEHFERFGG